MELSLKKELSDEQKKVLKSFCSTYCYNLNKRWIKSGSKGADFLKNNSDWLGSDVIWPDFIKVSASEPIAGSSQEGILASRNVGTSTQISPRKQISDLGPKQKKRRVDDLASTLSYEEQTLIYMSSLKARGYNDVADILDYLLKNPVKVNQVKDFIFSEKHNVMSSEKALGTMLSLKLTKWQYNTMKKSVQEEGFDIFPSYYSIQKAKSECYPPKEDIEITDMSAQIKIQSLLDKTVERLIKIVEIGDDKNKLKLISKYGFDGASNQSNYKQKSETNEDDSSIFMGSLVPIKLMCGEEVVWENETPNSTYLCRPIFFKFIKETRETITNEMNRLESEANNLSDTIVKGKSISHKLFFTMIDGKITSVLSETSTQSCDICKATPKEMNEINLISQKVPNTDIYKYGISSLHAWIRFMECILHISYRLEFKSWIAKGENRVKLENRKKVIQEAFKNRCGLLIDIVKQGHGTTNDGNTARRFFADVTTTASITGVDETLIRKFSIILETISSGLPINTDKFKEFADETIALYIQLYKWYYMPASVHKILVHGADIIKNLGLIPVGKLSEEAAESRNKDFRKYREHHSRKFCRRATNEDVFHNLLVTSDPFISTKRPKLSRKHKSLSKEAQSLVLDHDTEEADKENVAFVDVDTALSDKVTMTTTTLN